jgi:hypothetical protein
MLGLVAASPSQDVAVMDEWPLFVGAFKLLVIALLS